MVAKKKVSKKVNKISTDSVFGFQDLAIAYVTGSVSLASSLACTKDIRPEMCEGVNRTASFLIEKSCDPKTPKEVDALKKRCKAIGDFIGETMNVFLANAITAPKEKSKPLSRTKKLRVVR